MLLRRSISAVVAGTSSADCGAARPAVATVADAVLSALSEAPRIDDDARRELLRQWRRCDERHVTRGALLAELCERRPAVWVGDQLLGRLDGVEDAPGPVAAAVREAAARAGVSSPPLARLGELTAGLGRTRRWDVESTYAFFLHLRVLDAVASSSSSIAPAEVGRRVGALAAAYAAARSPRPIVHFAELMYALLRTDAAAGGWAYVPTAAKGYSRDYAAAAIGGACAALCADWSTEDKSEVLTYLASAAYLHPATDRALRRSRVDWAVAVVRAFRAAAGEPLATPGEVSNIVSWMSRDWSELEMEELSSRAAMSIIK